MHETVAYGEYQGRIVHIGEVQSGLGCNCRCLNCSASLVARKGRKRAHHFAHRAGYDCHGLAEGALHRLAKEILCAGSDVWIPAYLWSRSATLPGGDQLTRTKELTRAGCTRVVESHREYRGARGFIPDVCLQVGRPGRIKELFVEIVVTHAVDRYKRRLIRKHGIATIEIRLDACDLSRSPVELREKILGESTANSWVFHPAQVKHELEFVNARREAHRRRRASLHRDSGSPHASRTKILRQPNARQPSATWRDFRLNEAAVEAFKRRHGRYPNLEETKELFRGRR